MPFFYCSFLRGTNLAVLEMRVNYRLSNGADSLYARHMQAVARDWLNDDRDI